MAKKVNPPIGKDVKLIIILLILGLTLLTSSALLKKKEIKQDNNKAIFQSQYQKLLQKTWVDLETQEETTLKQIYEMKSLGGATIDDVINRIHGLKIAEKVKEKKLINFNLQTQKYETTQFGDDVYEISLKLQKPR